MKPSMQVNYRSLDGAQVQAVEIALRFYVASAEAHMKEASRTTLSMTTIRAVQASAESVLAIIDMDAAK